MLNLTYRDKPDFNEYEENISVGGSCVYVDPIRFHFAVATFSGYFMTTQARLLDYIRVLSFGEFHKADGDSVRHILVDYLGIDPGKFIVRERGQKRVSMDMRKVVLPLLQSLESRVKTSADYSTTMAYVLLKAYQEFAFCKQKAQHGVSKEQKFVPSEKVDKFGRQLAEIGFKYERRSTSRYYTSDDNVQGYDKLMVNAFTVPKDYVLVWADFSQIDFRVAYHIVLREIGSKYDEYYRTIEDKYEAIARAIWDFCGQPFDEAAFKRDRKGIKTSILARMYGAGLNTISANFENQELATMLDRYIRMNKGHQNYSAVVDRALKFGVEVLTEDYFGVKRGIPVTGSVYRDTDSALNSPIQSTSNSIIVHWTNAIIRQFRENGWGPDKAKVYLIRHDETLFMVHKDAMKDSWIFQNNLQVNIDNWAPLSVELDMGYYYTVHDDEVYAMYEESCKANQDRIIPHIAMPAREGKYCPSKDVLYVYCYSPTTLEGFAQGYLQGNIEAQKLKELTTEEERFQWVEEGIREGRIPKRSPLWYYIKYYNQYIIFKPDRSCWCLVKDYKHVLGTAIKNNCGFVDIKCVDTVFNTIQEGLYIKYSTASAIEILDLFKEFEEVLADGGTINKWLPL